MTRKGRQAAKYKPLHMRRFPNGTCLLYVIDDKQNERILWRHQADGSVDRCVEGNPKAEYLRERCGEDVCWVKVCGPTREYAYGVF
jgi:hypothetical protein